ncbi:MAG: alkaline phosphatase family protein [Acidobacteriaceae bacterium]|nr:alkaline phosphatase family protein [Acidobacteriaceae bacterium]
MSRIFSSRSISLLGCVLAATSVVHAQAPATPAAKPRAHHNVIIFVADGLRRGSVTPTAMPTFYKVRTEGTDFENSHSVFPTFTTANASTIATGHGLGDTGDFSNTLYPGAYLSPMALPSGATGTVTPFLESDEVLADMNGLFDGNYLGEQTLLSYARAHGFNVASVGKLGPTAIQQADVLRWEQDSYALTDAIVIDDQTGSSRGVPLPLGLPEAIAAADLAPVAPSRSNGYAENSVYSNGNAGDVDTPGTKLANVTQQEWFTNVATQVLLPRFADSDKPFVILFWSRDPDGTQHNEGDNYNSYDQKQHRGPGINGETPMKALHNADNDLKRILDWLDAHPEIKATTDVLLTSDHGFATISRRELDAEGKLSESPSKTPAGEPLGKEKPMPVGELPPGFLAMDLALYTQGRLFDPSVAGQTGDSVFKEVLFRDQSPRPHPSSGSAVIGMPGNKPVHKMDASDAQLVVAANGGSDLIYVPSEDPAIVHHVLELLTTFDYVNGLFVDDRFCPTPDACPGALPLSSIDLKGSTKVPTPAIVVNFKVFYPVPDLQYAVQVSDTSLQDGQGMHGGFGRESTWNNMAAIGPDFRTHFVDKDPVGNIDIAPTLAHLLGLDIPANGKLRGRAAVEAFTATPSAPTEPRPQEAIVSAPAKNGRRTVLEHQQYKGVHYFDRGCMIDAKAKESCKPF